MRTLVVVAHSDDETLGAASCLLVHPQTTWVLHGTNSAPRNPKFAEKAGFASIPEYAKARRRETLKAMALANVPETNCLQLDIPDQDAPLHIALYRDIVRRMVGELRIDRVLTHAFEGGHPDHDALAFAVASLGLPNVWEMPFYHSFGGPLQLQRFLPLATEAETETQSISLSPEHRACKREMLRTYRTQKSIVNLFPESEERFRRPPTCDFGHRPHPGQLYYETRPFGWTWETWRKAVHA